MRDAFFSPHKGELNRRERPCICEDANGRSAAECPVCDAHKETLEKDAPVFAPGKTDPATTSWETADRKTFKNIPVNTAPALDDAEEEPSADSFIKGDKYSGK